MHCMNKADYLDRLGTIDIGPTYRNSYLIFYKLNEPYFKYIYIYNVIHNHYRQTLCDMVIDCKSYGDIQKECARKA